jgi:SAM-dependent methyltransferase
VSQRDRRRSSADGLESLGRTDLSILEVGCGSGWFCPQLMRFGVVTGTDLSDEGLARAQQRAPEATFVAGDFMSLDLRTDFDVVVTLEVLSHVLDQRAFIGKLASHLRPGGHLMLATQNRFVLQYLNWRPPPGPGQLRRWVNGRELRDLLEPEFEVSELFSTTPRIARETMVWLRSLRALNPRVSAAVGDSVEGARGGTADQVGLARPLRWVVERLEAMGLGWSLMALARKRIAPREVHGTRGQADGISLLSRPGAYT